MIQAGSKSLQFGPFVLDPVRQHLLRDGQPVPVPRKVYEILALLVENAGEIVKKEDLLGRIWPEREIEDRNLTQHIYTLRRVLGDNPRTPTFILTIPGKGYLFNHPVRELAPGEVLAIVESLPRPGSTAPISSAGMVAENGATTDVKFRDGLSTPRLKRGVALFSRKFSVSVVVLTVIAAAFYLVRIHRPRPDPQTTAVQTPLVTLPGLKIDPAFSSDGQYVAFAGGASGLNLDIYVRKVNDGELVRLTSSVASDHNPVWSPDGRQLAFLRGPEYGEKRYQLVVIPALGGEERVLGEVWGGLDWSPDGRYFAVVDNDDPDAPTAVYLLSTDGRERRRLTFAGADENRYETYPRFSPDGRSILFARWRGDMVGEIFLVDLENGETRQLTSDQKGLYALQWAPDGKGILFISNRSGSPRLWILGLDETTPRLIDTGLGDLNKFDISPDSRRLVLTQFMNNTSIEVWALGSNPARVAGRDSGGSRPLCTIDSSRSESTPRYSPDGQHIAFISNRTGKPELWRADRDCANSMQLTRLGARGLGSPRWSPDGSLIAFDVRTGGPAEVMIMNADGSSLRRLTTGYMPAWSSDGQAIYFNSEQSPKPSIWRIPLVGGLAVPVTRQRAQEPVESFDGRILYFNSNERIWQKDLLTGKESVVAGLEEVPISRYWYLAPRAIYYVSSDSLNDLPIRRHDLQTSRSSDLFTVRGTLTRWVPGISVSPDESRLAVSHLSYIVGDVVLLDNWR